MLPRTLLAAYLLLLTVAAPSVGRDLHQPTAQVIDAAPGQATNPGDAAAAVVEYRQESDELTAKEILFRMAKAYEYSDTYRDSGEVTTTYIKPDRKRTTKKPFTTAFVRPGRFRFEFTRTTPGIFFKREYRYIAWSDEKEARVWWDAKPGVEVNDSLRAAIVPAGGISGGSAVYIPALLLPDQLGEAFVQVLSDLSDAQRADNAELDNVRCFRVTGKYVDDPATLWIDQHAFLIRRIDLQHQFPDFQTKTTVTYNPVVNEKIADDLLEFNPP